MKTFMRNHEGLQRILIVLVVFSVVSPMITGVNVNNVSFQSKATEVSPVGDPPDDNWWIDPVYEPGEIFKPPSFNWNKYWNVFKNHALWKLEARNPNTGEWIDATSLLTIYRNYTSDNSCKIGLEFITPDNGQYLDWRFSLAIDYRIKSFVNKSGDYEYTIRYEAFGEPFNVTFNWSDMLQYSGLIFKHGVTNIDGHDYFWFRVRRNNVPPAYHVYLDPEYTVASGTSVYGYHASQRKLVRQSNGTLWCGFHEDSDVHIAWSEDLGETWTDLEIWGAQTSRAPTLCVDSKDVVHYVFYSYKNDPGDFQLEYVNSTDWTNIRQMRDEDKHHDFPSIAVDSSDNLFVVYEKGEEGTSGDDQVALMRSLDNGGTWGVEQILTDEATLDDDIWYPDIAIDSNGVIHITYCVEDYMNVATDSVYHIWSDDTGATFTTWDADVALDYNSKEYLYHSFAITDNDVLHVVASDQVADNVYWMYNDSSGWKPATGFGLRLDTDGGLPSVSVDDNDYIYCLFDDVSYIDMCYNDTSSWSESTQISSSSTDTYPNLICAQYPVIGGYKTNRPKTGYALIYITGTTSVKYYASADLTWDVVNVAPTSGSEAPTNLTDCVDWVGGGIRTNAVVSDANGDTIDITWWSNSSGSWKQFGVANTSIASGTNISQLNVNFSTDNTWYHWWILLDDGEGGSANDSYSFKICQNITPPVPSDTPTHFANETPTNGSSDQSNSFTWTVDIWDHEGDIADWYVQCTGVTDSGSTNDTASLSLSGLDYETEYTVYCFANDTNNYTYEWFTFTTETNISGFNITINETYLDEFGLGYPGTYRFNIPPDMSGMKCFRRNDTGSWIQLTEKTSININASDVVYNGIEIVRFDYDNNTAFVSVRFPHDSNYTEIKFTTSGDVNMTNCSFHSICDYYDNRKAVVVIVGDDWDGMDDRDSGHQNMSVECRARNLWYTIGIIVNNANNEAGHINWTNVSIQVDLGNVEPASHSWSHTSDDDPYANPALEVNGSKQAIIENVTMPSQNTRGSTEYLWAWLQPYGHEHSPTRAYVADSDYLCDRDIIDDDRDYDFTSWGGDGLYEPSRLRHWMGQEGVTNINTLNGMFDTLYASGDIYLFGVHPGNGSGSYGWNWDATYWTGGYPYQHLGYIANYTDVWYVGYGQLYAYRYVEERGFVTVSNIDDTDVVTNNAPTFANETPTNQSTGICKIPTVYVIVSDANADETTCDFYTSPDASAWTWQQTNSTVASGTNISYNYSGATSYNTKYYWKVTADDGTDNTTSDFYDFTTVTNIAPTFANEAPTNGSINITLYDDKPVHDCYVVCNDVDADTFTVDFYSNESDGSTWVWQSGNTSVSPGDNISFSFTNAHIGLTKYWWRVYINDGTANVSDTYHFTTMIPWDLTDANPSNGSYEVAVGVGSWSVFIDSHENSGWMETTLCPTPVGCIYEEYHETCNETLTLTLGGNLYYNTNHTVYVNVTDANKEYGCWFNSTYWFWTVNNTPPTIQTNFSNGSYENPIGMNFSIVYFNDSQGDIVNNWMNCSTGDFWSVNNSNITGYIILSGLSYYTKYWVNCSSSDANNNTLVSYWFYTINYPSDTPPFMNNPNPSNNSYLQELNLNWNITMYDNDSLMNYTIHVSNGDSTADNNTGNGSKTIGIGGLSYFTQYTVWVNITDTYNNSNVTREFFYFTTKNTTIFVNNVSTVTGENPTNGSTEESPQPICNVTVTDQDGNSSTCDFYTSTDGSSWTWFQTNSSVLNTSIQFNYSTATSFNTKYYWNITVNDGLDNVSFFFNFTTHVVPPPVPGDTPPIVENETIANMSYHVDLALNWSIDIWDTQGDINSWDINCSDGNSIFGSVGNQTIGLDLTGLSYYTQYFVYVNCSDTSNTTFRSYWFYTKNITIFINNVTVVSSPVPTNGSTGISVQPICSVIITDQDGNTSTINFYTGSPSGWVWYQTSLTVLNQSIQFSYTTATGYSTLYNWRVTCEDELDNVSYNFTFTTGARAVNPRVSFTATSTESKTVLRPTMNSDVTEYKWSITGKRDAYNLETGWIPYADKANHISRLETGTYFITITGRNTDTGLTHSFTNEVKVTVTEEYVKPKKEVEEVEIGSRIINSLPEPFKSFFKERSGFELALILLASILILAFITRRKKIKKFIKLERHHEKR